MDVIYRRCCGLDVHKESVYACVLILENGEKQKQLRRFGTMTRELLELADWLRQLGVTHLAMEATGVYWKPVWNLLEGQLEMVLVNAQHIKKVPGRKTDIKDCEWIADLLQHGLLRGSFVPPQPQRDLRDLTRYRVRLEESKVRVANRIQKVLEDANVKLASVASDVLGVSGRAMLRAMIAGEQDPAALAELARRGLRKKLPELCQALQGNLRDHHRFLLRQLMQELDFLEHQVGEVEARIAELMRPFERAVTLWDSIPGIDRVTAWSLVAEMGTDLKPFHSSRELAAWAGLCPGNNESAGKRKSGAMRKGNRWLRRALSQAAWAAAHTKRTYLAARFHRLCARRGLKRAVVAIAHKLLQIAYWLLQHDCPYRELGGDYFDHLKPEALTRFYLRRLQQLGHTVTLQPAQAAQ